jgi:hypothetical protein
VSNASPSTRASYEHRTVQLHLAPLCIESRCKHSFGPHLVPRSNRNILAASARRNMVFTFYLARVSACACVHVCVRVPCRGAPVTTTVFVQSKSLSAYGEFAHPHPAHPAHRDNCLRDTTVPAEYTHRRADIVGYDIPAEAAAPFENLWCVPSPSLGVLQQPPATHPHNSPIHSLIRNASRIAAHSQFADATALSLSVCRESQGQDHERDHQVRQRSCHNAAAKVWLAPHRSSVLQPAASSSRHSHCAEPAARARLAQQAAHFPFYITYFLPLFPTAPRGTLHHIAVV